MSKIKEHAYAQGFAGLMENWFAYLVMQEEVKYALKQGDRL